MKLTETWHKDANGDARPDSFIDKTYFHPGTQHLYRVSGFGVDSERSLWLLHYRRLIGGQREGLAFHHTISDFTREGRFIEVKGD